MIELPDEWLMHLERLITDVEKRDDNQQLLLMLRHILASLTERVETAIDETVRKT